MSAGTLNYTPFVSWLEGRGHNDFTQFGEDGLIDACFEKIGETDGHCFEIGAADGRFFSNTLKRRMAGWYAVLIEGNPEQFDKLLADFGEQSDCILSQCGDLDGVLSQTAISKTPDLGIIDIDGQDFWLWHDLVQYRPRVMLVEISTQHDQQPIPARGAAYPEQAGLEAIAELGKQKGYTVVARTVCNALFVENSCLS